MTPSLHLPYVSGRARRWWLAVSLLAAGAAVSCLQPDPFRCTQDLQCDAHEVLGTCDIPSRTCIYLDNDCPSRYATADGECVPMQEPAGDDGVDDDGRGGDDSGSTSTDPASTDDGGDSGGGSDDAATTGAGPCDGTAIDITDEGIVGADSTYASYVPALAVDADLSTSWFSTGPEPGGKPTEFGWTMATDRCIERILVEGNALHETPEFRTNYGFETVEISIYDATGNVVFSQVHGLVGTPDPDLNVPTGGVVGSSVFLAFGEHENPACGGFAELQILGHL